MDGRVDGILVIPVKSELGQVTIFGIEQLVDQYMHLLFVFLYRACCPEALYKSGQSFLELF